MDSCLNKSPNRSLIAIAELDLAYASAPIKRPALLQVLGRVPHSAVVNRVNAQAAVIAPAVQAPQLRAVSRVKRNLILQCADRIGCQPASEFD